MSVRAGGRRFDERVWSVATVSSVVVQIVIGAVLIAWQLLAGHGSVAGDAAAEFRSTLLTAAAGVLVLAVLIGVVLISRPAPVLRGFGLSLVGSGVVTAIMGVAYVFWIR